jgi:hypothetical protein
MDGDAIMVKFTIDVNSNLNGLKNTRGKAKKAVAATVAKFVENVRRDSLNEVPVDTGALHDSFYSEVTGSVATFGYASEYAMWVHEDLSAYHLNGKAKFLEDPIRVHSASFRETFAEELRKQLGGV